jgi:nitroreductase
MGTRRTLLLGAGGAAGLALAGLGYRAWRRGVWSAGEGVAFAPWSDWQGSPADGIKRPLHAAILAANPHDTQPWLFALRDNAIDLYADRGRNLGSFDPYRREMHLGLGAAVENLVIAARALGWNAAVTPVEGRLTQVPDNTPILAARVTLGPSVLAEDPLFAAIPRRHTNRGPFRDERPDQAILSRVLAAGAGDAIRIILLDNPTARNDLASLILQATDRIIADPEMSADSARWFRTGAREIAQKRDGVTADTAGLSPLMTAIAKLMPDLDAASADRYWRTMTEETQLATAPLLGLLLVRDRLDMAGAIAAGRAWQRLHLAATVDGLAAQPLNQPVEMVDRDAALGRPDSFGGALAKLASAPGWEPTFVFRLGYAERPAGPSPRRGMAEVLRS